MKITLIQRFAKSDEYPFVAELRGVKDKQVHRFDDAHSRDEFVSGVHALARLTGVKIVNEDLLEIK